ncbi:MAG: hypothetical protein HZB51_32050 [Chloroflexi bacterium]|nr:hypothetical protein [Chloroflexota bacterium]
MIPPFAPYIPLKHPDDWLPIQQTRQAQPTPDVWVEWLADDAQPPFDARAISILSKLARWLDALRFRQSRRTKMSMIEKETIC